MLLAATTTNVSGSTAQPRRHMVCVESRVKPSLGSVHGSSQLPWASRRHHGSAHTPRSKRRQRAAIWTFQAPPVPARQRKVFGLRDHGRGRRLRGTARHRTGSRRNPVKTGRVAGAHGGGRRVTVRLRARPAPTLARMTASLYVRASCTAPTSPATRSSSTNPCRAGVTPGPLVAANAPLYKIPPRGTPTVDSRHPYTQRGGEWGGACINRARRRGVRRCGKS